MARSRPPSRRSADSGVPAPPAGGWCVHGSTTRGKSTPHCAEDERRTESGFCARAGRFPPGASSLWTKSRGIPEPEGMGGGATRPPSLPLRGLRGAGAPLRKRAAMHPGRNAPLRVAHRCASVEIHSGQFSRWGLLPRAPCQPGPSPLSVLTRLCPKAARVANRCAIRALVFREEGKPLPRGAPRREWTAADFPTGR